MKFLNLTSCYLLLLFVLISTAATTFGAPGGHPRGRGGKYKDKSIKCHGHGCSLAVRGHIEAMLTLNSFEKGGDVGRPSKCDRMYHSDDTLIVALSTDRYDDGLLCHKYITIYTKNGRSTKAMVVDECDVSRGCPINTVDGSKAVWEALGVPRNEWGLIPVTWSI